jgi:peptidoglycan hydrolase-like protein with peptidoglycan-binding domain
MAKSGLYSPLARGGRLGAGLACGLFLAGIVGGAPAAAQTTPSSAGPAVVDPQLQAAIRAFGELPLEERKSVQDSLVWTGDYNGNVDGEFGRMSFEAVRSFQRKANATATGILSEEQRKALAAAAGKAKAAAKFAVTTDETGQRLGIPRGIAIKTGKLPRGTRYFADKNAFTIETMALPASAPTLEAQYDQAKLPTTTRKVTYSILRPNFFVVAGEDKGQKFYFRLAHGSSGFRGYRVTYPKARAGEFDRVLIAIANSFEPFPEAAPVVATASGPAPKVEVKPAQARPVVVGAGAVIAPGILLTAASAIAGCTAPLVADAPAQIIASDGGSGLALLRIVAQKTPVARLLPREQPATPDEDIVVPVIASRESAPGFTVAIANPGASAVRFRVTGALQAGALGTPLFDRKGALAGVVVESRAAPFIVAGVVPAATYGAAPAAAIRLFLLDNKVTLEPAAAGPGEARSAGAVAAEALPSILAVACVK